MFICELGHVTRPGEPKVRVVAEVRRREYEDRSGLKTYGWEVVKEVDLCRQHAEELIVVAEAR